MIFCLYMVINFVTFTFTQYRYPVLHPECIALSTNLNPPTYNSACRVEDSLVRAECEFITKVMMQRVSLLSLRRLVWAPQLRRYLTSITGSRVSPTLTVDGEGRLRYEDMYNRLLQLYTASDGCIAAKDFQEVHR